MRAHHGKPGIDHALRFLFNLAATLTCALKSAPDGRFLFAMLSRKTIQMKCREYRDAFGVRPLLVDRGGRPLQALGRVRSLPRLKEARAHAVQEAVRWGEVYTCLLAPGIITWTVPLMDGPDCAGGLFGGEVMDEQDRGKEEGQIAGLVAAGAAHDAAQRYVRSLPAWPHARTQEAATALWNLVYPTHASVPMVLHAHRGCAAQQRQIAETSHALKDAGTHPGTMNRERLLLSALRAGDRGRARECLNQLIGAAFLRSANLTILKASMAELMGYLVRAAVEDSPHLDELLDHSLEWTATLLQADDLEDLAAAVRTALDRFMEHISRAGYRPMPSAIRRALVYIGKAYAGPIRLADVAEASGLSTFRLSHLMKSFTGSSVMDHVKQRRLDHARRLLEATKMPCSEIAYAAGFPDQSQFSRHFKRATGLTPLRYRRLRHEG